MAIENANLIEATLSFLATDPVELIESNGFDEDSLVRLSAGNYQITPLQRLNFNVNSDRSRGQIVQATQQSGTGFVAPSVQADGSLVITTWQSTGSSVDTGHRVDIIVYRLPTKS